MDGGRENGTSNAFLSLEEMSAWKDLQPGTSQFANESQARTSTGSAATKYSTFDEVPAPVIASSSSFHFINTTGPEQYAEHKARSRARAHLMRQVHQVKDKERASRNNQTGRSYIQPEAADETYNVAGPSRHSPFEVGQGSKAANFRGVKELSGSHLVAPAHRSGSVARGLLPHGATYCTPDIQSVGNHLTAGELVTRQILPHLMGFSLGGTEQRLVVPRIVSPHSFAVDLDDMERIRHSARFFDHNSIPMSVEFEAEWFNKAVSDRACYHGAMFISTADQNRTLNLPNATAQEIYLHKGQAIRLIQQRLEDPQERVEDGTLAAIVCLAAFENIMGSETIAGFHIGGIKRLVTIRGGMERLGMGGLLRTMITWADMGNSLAVLRRPYFCPWQDEISTLPKELEYLAFLESQWDRWGLDQPEINSYPSLDPFVTLIVQRCKQLSSIAPLRGPEAKTRDRSLYTSYVLILESHIQASLWTIVINQQRDTNPVIGATIRTLHIACLIYIYLALREIPIEVIIYSGTIKSLKLTIRSLDPVHLPSGLETGLFLWVLIVGGAAACGRPERSCFVELLATYKEIMSLRSWEDAMVVLRNYPWIENSFAVLARGFWDERGTANDAADTL